ncbi:MAG TPA: replication-relaxation family protein [Solirubrobacteraceae bacterium]|nr:replication-relaxation family protein [Solirubrobacteraceae bacterium]
MFEALHKRLQRRWWRRLFSGQPSIGAEVHCDRQAWLALTFPVGMETIVEAALRAAYPDARLGAPLSEPAPPPYVLRLKKHASFTLRAKRFDRFEHERSPTVNRLITAMTSCREPLFVQLALTPTPALFESYAKLAYKHREHRLSRERKLTFPELDPSIVEREELIGGLDVQHMPLFFVDIRIVASSRRSCERVASELRASGAENRLVERGTTLRHSRLRLYSRRVLRGEGNPLPSLRKGVFAATELACIWHLPSLDYATVPFGRSPVPVAPAPPAIMRVPKGAGTLRDALGSVSIHPALRRQNTAVPGTVEQGKSSYLVATVAEDLRRERCAVILLDPKGDAADAAISVVPEERTCTLLDFAHPTCGFDPLAVDAPADTIADYVVAALKNLFEAGDIKASSDRYLRNAIIAVLAYDRSSTLWDAARLLSVGEEGYAYRSRVAARLRTQPEFKEVSEFFAGELNAQLADARGTTTAKLDAPVNKLARLLNSPSTKRVLLNDSLRIDFDAVISRGEVLVVKGALGTMGAGNTSVLMQLLVGMLDASLARCQDAAIEKQRMAVALKVDEAPLVLNRGFAETMALKRSAGLETVACWQTDSQWIDRDIRAQLDALFAHRVYFATASVEDSRDAAALLMASFSDIVRPDIRNLSALGRPDARLHLPRHHAIASWVTAEGRQSPFVAQTLPLRVDRSRLAYHARRQAQRGGRYLDDLSQPHWERSNASAPPLFSSQQLSESCEQTPTPTDRPRRAAGPGKDPQLSISPPASAPQSDEGYRELADLATAHSVRWAKPILSPKRLDADPLDLEILSLLDSMRHLLSSQIHRRFNAGRATSTTQRRLKRLADAGLVARFQFHRRDGGGMPMCYSITPAGRDLCTAGGSSIAGELDRIRESSERMALETQGQAFSSSEQNLLRRARHDVRVAGWVLVVEQALSGDRLTLVGPERSAIAPPTRSTPQGARMLTLRELTLPGGRTAHDFLRTGEDGTRVEVERFQSIRPDATLIDGKRRELLIELDDRLPQGRRAAKLERYEHFLTGWSTQLRRYSSQATPLVVFVCRDRPRARECARAADRVLTAARAYPGEYPSAWDYRARERLLFVAERDAYQGVLCGWAPAALPPDVRASVGDLGARESLLRSGEIAFQ